MWFETCNTLNQYTMFVDRTWTLHSSRQNSICNVSIILLFADNQPPWSVQDHISVSSGMGLFSQDISFSLWLASWRSGRQQERWYHSWGCGGSLSPFWAARHECRHRHRGRENHPQEVDSIPEEGERRRKKTRRRRGWEMNLVFTQFPQNPYTVQFTRASGFSLEIYFQIVYNSIGRYTYLPIELWIWSRFLARTLILHNAIEMLSGKPG